VHQFVSGSQFQYLQSAIFRNKFNCWRLVPGDSSGQGMSLSEMSNRQASRSPIKALNLSSTASTERATHENFIEHVGIEFSDVNFIRPGNHSLGLSPAQKVCSSYQALNLLRLPQV
jgi:hypothetical protein